MPGGFAAQRHFHLEPFRLQEVLLKLSGVGVMLGEQDQQAGRVPIRASRRQASVHPLRQQPVRIGRAHSLGHAHLNEPEPLDLVAAEQAMTAGIPVRYHQRVTVFPGAQGGHRHADHPRYRADAVNRPAGLSLHSGHPSHPRQRQVDLARSAAFVQASGHHVSACCTSLATALQNLFIS